MLVLVGVRPSCLTEPQRIEEPPGQAPGPHPAPHPPFVPTGRGHAHSRVWSFKTIIGDVHEVLIRAPLRFAEAPYDDWISSLIAKQPFSKIFTVNDLFSPYLNQIITYFFSLGCRVRAVHCLLVHNQEINSGMGAVSRKSPPFYARANTAIQATQVIQRYK